MPTPEVPAGRGDGIRVSVAMGTYNGARFLEEQLVSILNQDRFVDELVIADDSSSDGTIAIAERILSGAHAPRLRILRGKGSPLGVTRNFERAVQATTGDIIVLSDQDDIWMPNRVSATLVAFAADTAVTGPAVTDPAATDPAVTLVAANARLVDAEGAPLGHDLYSALAVSASERAQLASGNAFDALLRRNLVTGATAAFRRELLDAALPFPASWVHDEWLAMLASTIGGVRMLDEPLIDYRQHGSNQIGVTKPTLGYRVRRMLEPRGERNATLARRGSDLVRRLDELGADESRRELARSKARFEEVRAGLPAHRRARIMTVLREFRAGSYDRFASQGRLDVARDILQPHS